MMSHDVTNIIILLLHKWFSPWTYLLISSFFTSFFRVVWAINHTLFISFHTQRHSNTFRRNFFVFHLIREGHNRFYIYIPWTFFLLFFFCDIGGSTYFSLLFYSNISFLLSLYLNTWYTPCSQHSALVKMLGFFFSRNLAKKKISGKKFDQFSRKSYVTHVRSNFYLSYTENYRNN